MPRWPWTRATPETGSARPAESAPAAEERLSAPPVTEVETSARAPATPPTAIRRSEAPAEPRGPEPGGAVEHALLSHDDAIASMSLVGRDGGLHDLAWIEREGERIAANESEAIAQRIVDGAEIHRSFEPDAFYESLGSLTSFREQGGFEGDDSELVLNDAFPGANAGARGNAPSPTLPPAQQASRGVSRAIDAKFADPAVAPSPGSGLVVEGGTFAATPAPQTAPQPRALARWANDPPALGPQPERPHSAPIERAIESVEVASPPTQARQGRVATDSARPAQDSPPQGTNRESGATSTGATAAEVSPSPSPDRLSAAAVSESAPPVANLPLEFRDAEHPAPSDEATVARSSARSAPLDTPALAAPPPRASESAPTQPPTANQPTTARSTLTVNVPPSPDAPPVVGATAPSPLPTVPTLAQTVARPALPDTAAPPPHEPTDPAPRGDDGEAESSSHPAPVQRAVATTPPDAGSTQAIDLTLAQAPVPSTPIARTAAAVDANSPPAIPLQRAAAPEAEMTPLISLDVGTAPQIGESRATPPTRLAAADPGDAPEPAAPNPRAVARATADDPAAASAAPDLTLSTPRPDRAHADLPSSPEQRAGTDDTIARSAESGMLLAKGTVSALAPEPVPAPAPAEGAGNSVVPPQLQVPSVQHSATPDAAAVNTTAAAPSAAAPSAAHPAHAPDSRVAPRPGPVRRMIDLVFRRESSNHSDVAPATPRAEPARPESPVQSPSARSAAPTTQLPARAETIARDGGQAAATSSLDLATSASPVARAADRQEDMGPTNSPTPEPAGINLDPVKPMAPSEPSLRGDIARTLAHGEGPSEQAGIGFDPEQAAQLPPTPMPLADARPEPVESAGEAAPNVARAIAKPVEREIAAEHLLPLHEGLARASADAEPRGSAAAPQPDGASGQLRTASATFQPPAVQRASATPRTNPTPASDPRLDLARAQRPLLARGGATEASAAAGPTATGPQAAGATSQFLSRAEDTTVPMPARAGGERLAPAVPFELAAADPEPPIGPASFGEQPLGAAVQPADAAAISRSVAPLEWRDTAAGPGPARPQPVPSRLARAIDMPVGRAPAPAHVPRESESAQGPLPQPLVESAPAQGGPGGWVTAALQRATVHTPEAIRPRLPNPAQSMELVERGDAPAVEAFGAVVSVQRAATDEIETPESKKKLSADEIQELSERVWKLVRRELRLERERQRGQA